MPRFVILHHLPPENSKAWRDEHWDLMLERDGVLRTWALPKLPVAGLEIEAIALPDHRLKYLEYEGPVSANRGSVTRVAAGLYRSVQLENGNESVTLRKESQQTEPEILVLTLEPRDGGNFRIDCHAATDR